MRKLNFDKHTAIFLVLAIFLIIEIFVVSPSAINKIVELNKKISNAAGNLETAKKEWVNNTSIEKKRLLEKEIERINLKFISSQEESKLLSFMSRSSKNFEVQIEALSPGKVKDFISTKFNELQPLPINLEVKSSFHDLALFLEYLQNSQYFFEVKELDISYEHPYNLAEALICGMIKTK